MYISKIKEKGFTLIEILISIGILTLILGLAGAFGSDVFSFNRILQTGLRNQEEAKKIVRPFANEVRSSTQSNLGAYAIAETTSTSFSFYTDIDGDGLREKLRYFLDGTEFKKGIIKPTGQPLEYNPLDEQIIKVIHDVVPGTIFYYYDSNYDGTAYFPELIQPVAPYAVRLIKVILTIDADPNQPPAAVEITTQVSMRNLKDNL